MFSYQESLQWIINYANLNNRTRSVLNIHSWLLIIIDWSEDNCTCLQRWKHIYEFKKFFKFKHKENILKWQQSENAHFIHNNFKTWSTTECHFPSSDGLKDGCISRDLFNNQFSHDHHPQLIIQKRLKFTKWSSLYF